MANKVSKRTLSIQEVINLVQSVDIPVLRIEKDLAIPLSVLQRAMKFNTKKPLPVKYEFLLVDYINKRKIDSLKKNIAAPIISFLYNAPFSIQPAPSEDMLTRSNFLKEIKAGVNYNKSENCDKE